MQGSLAVMLTIRSSVHANTHSIKAQIGLISFWLLLVTLFLCVLVVLWVSDTLMLLHMITHFALKTLHTSLPFINHPFLSSFWFSPFFSPLSVCATHFTFSFSFSVWTHPVSRLHIFISLTSPFYLSPSSHPCFHVGSFECAGLSHEDPGFHFCLWSWWGTETLLKVVRKIVLLTVMKMMWLFHNLSGYRLKFPFPIKCLIKSGFP